MPAIEPVLSPEVPAEARALLVAHADLLTPARNPPPQRVPTLARRIGRGALLMSFLTVMALIPGLPVGTFVYVSTNGFSSTGWLVVAALAALYLTGAMILTRWEGKEDPALRSARVQHGNYLTADDFDSSAEPLLDRARKAVEQVLESQVNKKGLLDGIANDVVLPQELWDIARSLHQQTLLRAEQDRARAGLVTTEVTAVLEPQERALERSVASVTQRVERLERYAERVAEAEAAHTAHQLMESNDRYLDLLADTPDTTAMAELQEQADHLQSDLRRSLEAARDLGRTLQL